MRLKFWEKEPDYDDIEFVKPRRPRETLSQTAERIIQRKMKATPMAIQQSNLQRSCKGVIHKGC